MANDIARRLRKTMTPQEVKVWHHLRSWRVRGFHFRRQAPRFKHIVDFICLRHRLVVEIDGGQHNEDGHAHRDRVRDNQFFKNGFRVLRFWNCDVDHNLNGVLETIDLALREAPHPTAPSERPPSPQSGEG